MSGLGHCIQQFKPPRRWETQTPSVASGGSRRAQGGASEALGEAGWGEEAGAMSFPEDKRKEQPAPAGPWEQQGVPEE